jgi:hypothetical protein
MESEQEPEPRDPVAQSKGAVERPKRTSDLMSFQLPDFDRFVVDELIPNSQPPGRWAAMNAVRHTNRAWKLRELDPTMAAFRAITGEEEAATALFRALRRLNYPASKRLQLDNHLHKNAVTPFLQAVWSVLGPRIEQQFPGSALSIAKDENPPRIFYRLKTDGGWYEPTPPLYLYVTKGQFRNDGTMDPATEMPLDFGDTIAQQAAESGGAGVKAYLQKRARLRSEILYAAETGYPEIGTPMEPALLLYRANTLRILKLFLLIDGYGVQSFASQCLLAFLRIVEDPKIEVKFV